MARRGLQALHEICAGDPEGGALNLQDAHLRNSTDAVTVDDVSEQMSLLGISDKSLAWIGASGWGCWGAVYPLQDTTRTRCP